MNTQTKYYIGNEHIFIQSINGDGRVAMSSSLNEALLLDKEEADSAYSNLITVSPILSCLHVLPWFDVSKLDPSRPKFETEARKFTHNTNQIQQMIQIYHAWEKIDDKLWLFDKGMRGLVIHLTRLDITSATFSNFFLLCKENPLIVFALIRAVSLNLLSKNDIHHNFDAEANHRKINSNKLIPVIMNKVSTFGTAYRAIERQEKGKFLYTDGTQCSICQDKAVQGLCWHHYSTTLVQGD